VAQVNRIKMQIAAIRAPVQEITVEA